MLASIYNIYIMHDKWRSKYHRSFVLLEWEYSSVLDTFSQLSPIYLDYVTRFRIIVCVACILANIVSPILLKKADITS